jgi:FKBP-type peptidyl-prolyl cis-trans isomerase FklB
MKIAMCAALVLGAFATQVAAQQPPKEPPLGESSPLKDLRAKASYAIGLSIGKSLKRDGVEPDLEALAKGLADATKGAKALLTPAEINEAMDAFQRELAAKQAARRKELTEKNQKEGEAFLAANKKKEGVQTTASGLQYKVIREGTGKVPKVADTVKTHYRGTLLDGTVFDSSYDRGEPAAFQVGGVIPGWTEALQLMKVGSKWQIFVPANLAYAERGSGPDIGPHATLVFEIELLGIEDGK